LNNDFFIYKTMFWKNNGFFTKTQFNPSSLSQKFLLYTLVFLLFFLIESSLRRTDNTVYFELSILARSADVHTVDSEKFL